MEVGSMPAKKLPRCTCCGRAFHPDPYNADRQKFCKHPDCIRERKRKRNRKYYHNKYHSDKDFQAKEIARISAGHKRRRKNPDKSPRPPPHQLGVDIQACLVGLIAQHTALTDPVLVVEAMHTYADRGHRLAFGIAKSDQQLL